MYIFCVDCKSRQAIQYATICGPCSGERERAALADSMRRLESTNRLDRVGRLDFVPEDDAERRLHKAALRQKQYGSGLA